jgi:two-component system LytT family response regulator
MGKKIRIIVVDDDAGCVGRLCDDLTAFPDVEVVAACRSAKEALKRIIGEQPDILFLDVEMPEMTGIELLKRIQPELHTDVKVVFYTAYNKYLIEALRMSAFDFLLKPYTMDELTAIFDRYHSTVSKNLDQSLRQLLGQDRNIFAIQTVSGLMLVICERILMFDYVKESRCWQMLLTDNSKPQRLRQSAGAGELLALNKVFVQISKECIVNMNYLSTIENRTLQCRFYPPYDSIERMASRRYFQKIREELEII